MTSQCSVRNVFDSSVLVPIFSIWYYSIVSISVVSSLPFHPLRYTLYITQYHTIHIPWKTLKMLALTERAPILFLRWLRPRLTGFSVDSVNGQLISRWLSLRVTVFFALTQSMRKWFLRELRQCRNTLAKLNSLYKKSCVASLWTITFAVFAENVLKNSCICSVYVPLNSHYEKPFRDQSYWTSPGSCSFSQCPSRYQQKIFFFAFYFL